MTKLDKIDFKDAKYCHICNRKYKPKVKEDILRDHDHYTGKYMGSAHKRCNLVFYYEKSFNVFFHNLRGMIATFLYKKQESLIKK